LNRISLAKESEVDIWEETLLTWKDVSGSHITVRQFAIIVRDLILARIIVKKTIKLHLDV
jgi:hypothetical protein